MLHISNQKPIDDYESSGPRPPVPGQESRMFKMTEEHNVPVDSSSKHQHHHQHHHLHHHQQQQQQPQPQSRISPPSYAKWPLTLSSLLEDREGVEIFKKYVEAEGGIHSDRLNFYFACEGLKQQTEDAKIKLMVNAIYRFLKKSQLYTKLTEDLRRTIKAGLKNEVKLSTNIFNQMQQDIVRTINETTYQNFFQSDLYIDHIEHVQRNTAAGTAVSSSSGSGSCTDLPRNSGLPTLHEDTELSINDDVALMTAHGSSHQTPAEIPMRLTRDLLLATQKRRLEIRPQGAHGYSVYNASYSSSYNPVSRVDSERQSCSSGGKTDSDTRSMSSCSRDGRPHIPRRQSTLESNAVQQNAQLNKKTDPSIDIPRTERKTAPRAPTTEELILVLIPKLEEVQRQQNIQERLNRRLQEDETSSNSGSYRGGAAGPPSLPHNQQGQELADALFRKLQLDDDNDQSILDQHVSRVWSDLTPHRSPGTVSPCPDLARRRTHEPSCSSSGANIAAAMKHSRSMPEHAVAGASTSRKLTNKWPSMNTDSGISLFSADTTLKSKDTKARSMGIDAALSTAFQLEEARRRLEDETRKSRRYSQYNNWSTASGGSQECTVAVYTFLNEDLPYRIKLPGTQPTLRQFKDYLPKKGSFRFFFKTACEDPENPVIQEEIVNDNEILPLFEGKVMGLVKPFE